jgi:drug/metabolite transporter (DMT)-like permease
MLLPAIGFDLNNSKRLGPLNHTASNHRTPMLVFVALISACLFGAATPASKALLAGLPAQTLAGLLYLGAAMGVLPLIFKERGLNWPWQADRRARWLLTGAVGLGGVLGPLLVLLGLKAARAGSVSLWLNLELVTTVVLGHFIFKEQLTLRGWIAASGTLVAVLLLVGAESSGGVLPIILVALGCLCWGFDNHFTALIDDISPAQITLSKGLVAGPFNLIMGSVLVGFSGHFSWILLALLVGALSYGISTVLYVTAAQGLGASRSQLLFSTAPFFGLLWSVTFLGEPLAGIQVLAAALMAVSLVILLRETHDHMHWHAAKEHQHEHRHDDAHHNHAHKGSARTENHQHRHRHDPGRHSHKHWPDLHHRHHH